MIFCGDHGSGVVGVAVGVLSVLVSVGIWAGSVQLLLSLLLLVSQFAGISAGTAQLSLSCSWVVLGGVLG